MINKNWKELRREIFTPEEIAAFDARIKKLYARKFRKRSKVFARAEKFSQPLYPTWKEIQRIFILPDEQKSLSVCRQLNLALERAEEIVREDL